jgi:hypothetical protein
MPNTTTSKPPPAQPEAGKPPPPLPPEPLVQTVADEQRERSAEIEHEGVEKWKEQHDERAPEDRTNKPTPGVAAPAPASSSKK